MLQGCGSCCTGCHLLNYTGSRSSLDLCDSSLTKYLIHLYNHSAVGAYWKQGFRALTPFQSSKFTQHLSIMGFTRKIESLRSSLDHNRSTTSGKRDSVLDAPKLRDPAPSLPIAEQFMQQSPTMQTFQPRPSQDEDFEKATRRKPLPSETERAPFHALPENSTIRTVPNEHANYESSETGRRSSDADHLVPNFSKLNVGKSSNRSEANAAANPLPEEDVFYEANTHNKISRRSLDKPLPAPPANGSESAKEAGIPDSYDQTSMAYTKARDLERELGVEGVLDLSNTTDVEVSERWAPAVTHETVRQDVHQVREEVITREIHQHHYIHRVQPVEEVEVLPARHYMLDGEGIIREVPAHQVASRVSKDAQKAVAEGFKKTLPKSTSGGGRRTFTAREFPGDEGDYKEYVTPEGVTRSERYWVHPPELETGGYESGQTQPFHLGSSRPEHDGWRSGI